MKKKRNYLETIIHGIFLLLGLITAGAILLGVPVGFLTGEGGHHRGKPQRRRVRAGSAEDCQ